MNRVQFPVVLVCIIFFFANIFANSSIIDVGASIKKQKRKRKKRDSFGLKHFDAKILFLSTFWASLHHDMLPLQRFSGGTYINGYKMLLRTSICMLTGDEIGAAKHLHYPKKQPLISPHSFDVKLNSKKPFKMSVSTRARG